MQRVLLVLGLPVLGLLCLVGFWIRGRERPYPSVSSTKIGTIPDENRRAPADPANSENHPRPQQEISKDLARFLAGHREADRSNNDLSHTRFSRELGLGLREGRLLALSFPDRMAPLLDEIALDASRDPQDRFFAIHLLGCLTDAGNKAAESSLVRLCFNPDRDISGTALLNLAQADQQGAHRQIYEQGCEKGIIEAFDAMAHWADPASMSFMKKLANLDREKSSLPDMAARTIQRYDILLAADWVQKLTDIIANPSHDRSELSQWAIRAAQVRGMPGLDTALRSRLDADWGRAMDEFKELEKVRLKKFGSSGGVRSFEALFATEPMGETLFDSAHDDALLVYSKSGGKLTEVERKRLRTFGYEGDPRQRLAQIQSEQK